VFFDTLCVVFFPLVFNLLFLKVQFMRIKMCILGLRVDTSVWGLRLGYIYGSGLWLDPIIMSEFP